MTIILAGLAMFCKDALGTLLVVAEANNHPVLSGGLDVGMDVCSLAWIALGVHEALTGTVTQIALLVVALSIGSLAATITGVHLGHRWMPDKRPLPSYR